jgi:hypothetical protein
VPPNTASLSRTLPFAASSVRTSALPVVVVVVVVVKLLLLCCCCCYVVVVVVLLLLLFCGVLCGCCLLIDLHRASLDAARPYPACGDYHAATGILSL